MMTTPLHSIRFPSESEEYRVARNELLEAEIELRRRIEAVAVLRRTLPLGGEVPEDYAFDMQSDSGEVRQVRLSELFAEGKDTLIVYSYMFSLQMARPCASCTSILDGLDGEAPHVEQQVNFVVVAKSQIGRIMELAEGRGWRNLRLLSSAHNTYNRDYHGEDENGSQLPALNVFVRRDGRIYHFYNAELLYAPVDPDQNERHVDMIWPLWNLLDVTPEGRGMDWHPRLSY